MPIASRKPTAEVVTKPQLPRIEPENYKSIVYDDAHKPLHSLIAYIEGAPWTVDYYSQVVNEHNDLRDVDSAQPGTYQQYTRIVAMEIRVTGPLQSSYDADRAITQVTGSGSVYPFVVPNVGDIFFADAADNQTAIFRITQVDRKTFNLDSVHAIEYELMGYVSQLPDIFQSVQNKTIKSYHFSKERLVEGLSPILKAEEFEKVTNLKVLYRELVQYYFRTFFDRRYFTLVMPGQLHAYYDPHLVNYVLKLVDSFDAPEIRMIKQLPTDGDAYIAQPQFWELMFNKDYNGRMMCNRQMGLVHKHMFNQNTYIVGLLFHNIEYVVYPVNPDVSLRIGTPNDIRTISGEEVMETTGFKGTLPDASDNVYTKADKTYAIIHDVLVDDNYVLSANFYDETAQRSVLEILVKDYMTKKSLDLDMLYAVCNNFRHWNRLNQFYYGPILMTLIKEADRGQYT